MKPVIGVNHFMQKQRTYSIQFEYPLVSLDILSELKGKTVGLELVPPAERNALNDAFWKNNTNNVLSLYNPEAHKYFSDLESVCDKVVYLDSPEITKDLIRMDSEYRSIVKEINSMEFQESIDHKKLLELLLAHRKVCLEALSTDFTRDTLMLEKILQNDMDVAVVGMGHANNWMNSGKYDYSLFKGEDFFNGVPLVSLSSAVTNHDFKYFDIVEKWHAQSVNRNRKRQPTFIGLFEPFMPDTYFEIFMDSGKNTGECFDSYGHSKITIEQNDERRFFMKKEYLYHSSGKLINFEYAGKRVNGRISGDIRGYGSFVLVENSGNALDTLAKLYADQSFIEELKQQPYFAEGVTITENHFPLGVGNDLGKKYRDAAGVDNNDDLPF